ncbi:hypothetical protein CMI38_03590 [Candidatus Pacearchaeota archaeon]|jgi:hypothetical protein|nr:hypothetical protein [Candidatus Pacearchaeota archaeon]|tara:strand:+ start:3142 stop:3402 length:261 start_codon:yes stop_codon:yes gene_type:complete
MEEKIISTRISKELFNKMRSRKDINWSSVIRNALVRKSAYEDFGDVENDKELMVEIKEMDRLVEGAGRRKGKTSTEIVREWRDKRK